MRVEPASLDQIRSAGNGRMVLISADAGSVAAQLKQIDPGLKVRFAESANPPFWAIYHESDDGRTTHLVLTTKAYQGNTGIWTGLDDRVVKRIVEIDPRNGYDYVAELDKADAARAKVRKDSFREKAGAIGELAAWATRKDLGESKGVTVPRKP